VGGTIEAIERGWVEGREKRERKFEVVGMIRVKLKTPESEQ
jgi:hypothetical protein